MKIREILKGGKGAATIAFLGDSITQGCFEIYEKCDGGIETVFDKNHAYHTYLAEIFAVTHPNIPINMINAGVSGDSAAKGLERLERDVLRHGPDLAVVCFGLNDSSGGFEGIGNFVDSLGKIFDRLKKEDIDTIFMTPNMMNTSISPFVIPKALSIAENTMKCQCEGVFDAYIKAAISLCKEQGVTVCDCYRKWKYLEQSGADITSLLSNGINHPTREMNRLFAVSLYETLIFRT